MSLEDAMGSSDYLTLRQALMEELMSIENRARLIKAAVLPAEKWHTPAKLCLSESLMNLGELFATSHEL